ncbi:MAG: aldo/keto reductase [Bacteroidota bacterium]
MTIDKVKIAPNGPLLSRVVAGVMTWGEWGADFKTEQMAGMIRHCIDRGVTTFDHADIYGHYGTEATFGDALGQLGSGVRTRMQLVTKCGIRLTTDRRPENQLKSYDLSKEYIIASAEQSLKNLRTDYLDLFLIHRPSPLMHPAEIAEAFSQLEQAGKVKAFGVSNFTPSQFDMLAGAVNLVTNQVECHPLHTDCFYDGTFDGLITRNIRPMIWSPLGGAKYFKGEGTAVLRLRNIVKILAKKYGDVGEDVILLAWLLRHPVGPIPVVGTTKIHRINSTRLAMDLNMETQDWFAILEAARGHEVA